MQKTKADVPETTAEWLPTTAKCKKRERNAIYHGEMPLDLEFFISLWFFGKNGVKFPVRKGRTFKYIDMIHPNVELIPDQLNRNK